MNTDPVVSALKIAKVLVEDKLVVTSFLTFSSALEISIVEAAELELKLNQGSIKLTDYFVRLLNLWCQQLEHNATVAELCTILIEYNWIYCKGKKLAISGIYM